MKRIDAFCHKDKEVLTFGEFTDLSYCDLVASLISHFKTNKSDVLMPKIGPYSGKAVYIHYRKNKKLEDLLQIP